MMSIADVLGRYQPGLSEDDVAVTLAGAFEQIAGADSAPLTDAESVYLDQHAGKSSLPGIRRDQGFVAVATLAAVAAGATAGDDRALAAVASAGALLASTVSIQGAAELLGVDRSRVSHRLRDDQLWATAGTRRRIPTWQINDGKLVPGLARIVPAIPAGVDPLDIAALMTGEQDETGGRSPVAWLLDGGLVDPVVELVAGLDRW